MNVGPIVFKREKKKISPKEKHLWCSEKAGTDQQLVCRSHKPKPYSFYSKAPSLSKLTSEGKGPKKKQESWSLSR